MPYDKSLGKKPRGRDLHRRAQGEPAAPTPHSAQGEPPVGGRASGRHRQQRVLINVQAAISQVEEELKVPKKWRQAEADPA